MSIRKWDGSGFSKKYFGSCDNCDRTDVTLWEKYLIEEQWNWLGSQKEDYYIQFVPPEEQRKYRVRICRVCVSLLSERGPVI